MEHSVWNRDFPVRYQVVRTSEDDNGNEITEVLGRCVDAEGLFADPPPLPRETLTLRGCEPESALLEGKRLLGDMTIEVLDGDSPKRWWMLQDVVVIDNRPNADNPRLLDVVVGAGVQFDEDWGNPRLAARCQRVNGSYHSRPQLKWPPITLVGCEPEEPMLIAMTKPSLWEGYWTRLQALDRNGRVMAHADIGLAVVEARPSVLGGSLVDITFDQNTAWRPRDYDRRPLAARDAWEIWYEGIPTSRDLWSGLSEEAKREWLALTARTPHGPQRTGGTHHLHGRFVTDHTSLRLAMSEALLGPGGHARVRPPFTLVWHDSGAAGEALADDVVGVMEFLEAYGVTVVLQ